MKLKDDWWLMLVGMVIFLTAMCRDCHGQSSTLVRVQHDSFISYYDIRLLQPALVCYVLEWPHFAGALKVSGRHFKADTKLPRPRVKDKHYTGSGYVRGHLCSAGDRDSNSAWLKETYLTSNLCPMTSLCNSGAWRVMEDSCRTLAIAGHSLMIARGPLFAERPDTIRNGMPIVVPEGFFCFYRCRHCDIRGSFFIANAMMMQYEPGSYHIAKLVRDSRVSLLLHNIIGAWSREEYETITH